MFINMKPLFENIGGNTFKLTNINNQLKSLHIKNYYIDMWDNPPRPVLCIPINSINIAFYRSSKGTSGKTQGNWYPVLGIGFGDWFIKGSKSHLEKGYGVQEIKSMMDKLNCIFPENMDLDQIVEILKNNLGEPDISLKSFMKNTYGKDMGVQPNLTYKSHIATYKHINNIISNFGRFFDIKQLFNISDAAWNDLNKI